MKKPVLLDGAWGTSLWAIAEQNGVKKDPVWVYNIEHPDFVRRLASEYADAGSKIIQTNTFGANEPSVRRSSSYDPKTVVREGVRLVKEAVEGKDVSVYVGAGPLTELMEPFGDLSEEDVDSYYSNLIDAGLNAGAEGIMLITFIDLEMLRVAATAAKRFGVSLLTSMSFAEVGKTMFGNSPEQVAEVLGEVGVDAVGINCSLGPVPAMKVLKDYAEKTNLPLLFKPNAGLPITQADGKTTVKYTPEQFVKECIPAMEHAAFIGGCCGTDASFVRELKHYLDGLTEE